jgi:hypothetical protein
VTVSPDTTTKQLRHNLTAIKFTQKIRDALVKKQSKRANRGRSIQDEIFNENIKAIENELATIRDKIFATRKVEDPIIC